MENFIGVKRNDGMIESSTHKFLMFVLVFRFGIKQVKLERIVLRIHHADLWKFLSSG